MPSWHKLICYMPKYYKYFHLFIELKMFCCHYISQIGVLYYNTFACRQFIQQRNIEFLVYELMLFISRFHRVSLSVFSLFATMMLNHTCKFPATIKRKHKTCLLCNFQLDQETYLHDGQLLLLLLQTQHV